MLNGDSNENSKKSVGLISKRKNFAHAAHFFCTFLWCCFAQLHVQRETSYMSLHILYRKSGICSLFLFTATHFHLAGCYMYYFSFSHHQFSWFFLLLSTFTYACGSDGHAYGHVITKISRIHIEPNFGGGRRARTMDWWQALNFFSTPHLAIRARLSQNAMFALCGS